MTSRVVSLTPAPELGDSVLIDGRPHVVVSLLPHLPGRRAAARVSPDLPCGVCETALRYDAPRRRWWCPGCRTGYDRPTLVDLVTEHVAEGVLAGKARRNRVSRSRQVVRGAPGAAAALLQAADAGGAPSRIMLIASVTGAERRAMRWALRDAGAAPLSPERCRQAARDLNAAGASPPAG